MADRPSPPPIRLADADHGMNVIAAALYEDHRKFCAQLNISVWDYCCALANVQGWILADQQDMPEAHAMKRVERLSDLVRTAYHRHPRPGQAPGGRA